jgi:hypothetical protein
MANSRWMGALPVAALVLGCASQWVEDGESGGAPRASWGAGGTSATTRATAISGECRSVLPNPSSVQGQACSGGARDDGCESCRCMSDGRYQCSEYDCNTSGCPARLPQAGSLCAGDPCECTYDSGCGQPHRAQCVGGGWRVLPASCAPPCPDPAPAAGEPCYDGSLRCDYGEGCGATHVLCGAGFAGAGNEPPIDTWHVLPPSPSDCPNPLCPAAPPAPGSACQPERDPCWFADPTLDCQQAVADCYWPNACGGSVHGSCDIMGWAIEDQGCPDQPGCPLVQPRTGDACGAPTPGGTSACAYEVGASSTSCLCASDRRWACYEWYDVDPTGGVQIAGTRQPGAVPSPFEVCEQGAWCDGIGSTCFFGTYSGYEVSMLCTVDGWQQE